MTSDAMVSKVGLGIDNEYPENKFGRTERYLFLNDSQLYVVGRMPIHMVRQAEEVSAAQAVDSAGGLDLTALDPLILNGDRGILDVLHSGGFYCRGPIDDDEWRDAVEYSVAYPSTDPIIRLQGTVAYLKPFTFGTTTGIIRYKSVPVAITAAVPCAFSDDVQELIVDMAVSIGLKAAHQYDASVGLKGMVDTEIGKHKNAYSQPENVRFDLAQVLGDNFGGSNIKTRT